MGCGISFSLSSKIQPLVSDQDLSKLTAKVCSQNILQLLFLIIITNHEVVSGDFHHCGWNFSRKKCFCTSSFLLYVMEACIVMAAKSSEIGSVQLLPCS